MRRQAAPAALTRATSGGQGSIGAGPVDPRSTSRADRLSIAPGAITMRPLANAVFSAFAVLMLPPFAAVLSQPIQSDRSIRHVLCHGD